MIQTVEAVVDASGKVRLLGEVSVPGPRRALVTVLEEPAVVPGEVALLAEPALSLFVARREPILPGFGRMLVEAIDDPNGGGRR